MSGESLASRFEQEWEFNKQDPASPPRFGLCFSGGGNRSAAFAIGILSALHESKLLDRVDLISAVSGGSYALSWLLLQPFYDRECRNDPRGQLPRVQQEMFDPSGAFQEYLAENDKPLGAGGRISLFGGAVFRLAFDLIAWNVHRLLSMPFANSADFANQRNASSNLRKDYREGIQSTYQFFPDSPKKAPAEKWSFFTNAMAAAEFLDLTFKVEPVTFPRISDFARRAGLPGFVFNTTVIPPNPGDGVLLRHRIFELGSVGFGCDSCGYLTWKETDGLGWEPGEMAKAGLWKQAIRDRRSGSSPYATLRNFNTAAAISGAAIDAANAGEQKLRWLIFLANLGLAYVVPNPANPKRLVRLSDGGHSENLGLYSLLRRRCRNIVIIDAEYDLNYTFGSYRKVKQAAKDELQIQLSVPALDDALGRANSFHPDTPLMAGSASTSDGYEADVFYIKLSMHPGWLGDQAALVTSYAEGHQAFPQETTLDQYFGPARFRAYRALGCAAGRTLVETSLSKKVPLAMTQTAR